MMKLKLIRLTFRKHFSLQREELVLLTFLYLKKNKIKNKYILVKIFEVNKWLVDSKTNYFHASF